ncbi:MAG TPA: YceI family protein [Steroidobacteraceae bacterium]|nr:YceI family protein [Steroidobacteraceae bacterium]
MKFSAPFLAAALIGLGSAASAAPVTYTFDTTHSRVTFYINHLGFSNSVGEFRVGDGTLVFDNDDWSKSKVEAKIPVQTLELGDVKWNTHVLSHDFLDAATYPEISFVSNRIERTDATHGRVHGDLTVHGVTKPVVLDLTVNKVGEHPMRKTPAAGFTATVTVHRSEFGVTYLLPVVGDDVTIRIEVESYVPKA